MRLRPCLDRLLAIVVLAGALGAGPRLLQPLRLLIDSVAEVTRLAPAAPRAAAGIGGTKADRREPRPPTRPLFPADQRWAIDRAESAAHVRRRSACVSESTAWPCALGRREVLALKRSRLV